MVTKPSKPTRRPARKNTADKLDTADGRARFSPRRESEPDSGRPRAPDGLSTRGEALWAAVVASRALGAADLVLLEESCRIADRLEQLDRLLRGDVDTWTRIVSDREGSPVELRVDSALAEARQQQSVLRQLIVTLGLSTSEPAREARSALDDLAARRTARGAGTANPVEPASG